MRFGRCTERSIKVLEAGTSAARLAVPRKGLLMLSALWESNVKIYRTDSRLLSLRGLMAKRLLWGTGKLTREDAVSVQQHEKEWNEIFDGIHEVVDACAFQDGHIDYDELDAFFTVNKKLADKYGMQCWTNAESFDRDMPIRFLPIKFDKLRMKLEAAKRAGYDKAITFEFSHFMSPQSAYLQAGHLYDRYREYFEIK